MQNREEGRADALRQQLKQDETAVQVAKGLGIELDDYVEEVVFFATNPDEMPVLEIVSDDVLEAEDFIVPEAQDLADWFDAVETGELTMLDKEARATAARVNRDNFGEDAEDHATRRQAAVVGRQNNRLAPQASDLKGDVVVDVGAGGSALKVQLLAQRMSLQMEQPRRARAAADKNKKR